MGIEGTGQAGQPRLRNLRSVGPRDDARPIFVVGNSRSGTTMVARMLGRHQAVHALRELHFFEELWSPDDGDRALSGPDACALVEQLLHRARVGYNLPFDPDPQHDTAAKLVSRAGQGATAVDLYWEVLDDAARGAGASHPCEQTPRNVYFTDAILQRFPEARIVSVLRDPRDVVLSQRNWWRRGALGATEQTWRTSARRFLGYHPIMTTLLWRSGVRAAERISDPRVLMVRFEDVVAAPGDAVDQMCAHCRLDPEPSMLDVPRYNSSNRTDPGGTGVDPTVVGAGLAELSSTELWVVQRLAAGEMTRNGYEAKAVRPTAGGIVWTGATLVPKLVATTITNLRRSSSPWRSVRRRLRA